MMISYVGYLASALVLCTFLTRTMVPLRFMALGDLGRSAAGRALHRQLSDGDFLKNQVG